MSCAFIQLKLAGDIMGNHRPVEIRRITVGEVGRAGEAEEALHTGGDQCSLSGGGFRQRSAGKAAGAPCPGEREHEPQGLKDAGGGTLQAASKEDGTTRGIQQSERSNAPEEGATADPREMMGHSPDHPR